MKTVCLNMIVKNEAHVIRRCLESVRPLVNTWVILDTGSTDGTQDVIRETLADLPGVLHESPWKGFDLSRTEAIDLARDRADYLLFIDADDVMETGPGFAMPEPTHDCYDFEVRHGPVVHWRPTMVSTRLPWRYVGVLHEYLECGTTFSRATFEGARMVIMGGGGRLQGSQRKKYLRDAAVLKEGLAKEPGNARYAFYLAQSWRDADEPAKALAAYDRRAAMGGFEEEAFCARLYAARLASATRRRMPEVTARFLDAHEYRPTRAEPLGELAHLYRVNGERWPLAYMFARRAAEIPRPSDILFVEDGWYDWRALDELAVSSYWMGEYRESLECCEKLLDGKALPEDHRQRTLANRDFARAKLRKNTTPAARTHHLTT
ncbi:glycosyltransferase [Streptomyces sp. AK08-02]|uniref:tetratricopeptide repeat-containing glycosyltransferase n=1 Tax=Streptomyces sp. AK08-02 TaxID=3028654 RepID=UPI0029A45FA6|nr:glycosyltransferase [Streptomyces sp. AK08-02]MDX3753318.1 glycosyltransferase [Streptomyces sp. AK08-02]